MNAVAGHTEGKILAIVHERGSIVLEKLLPCLPESTWNQVFTSVDALSRRGAICLRRRGFDYELWAPSSSAAGLVESMIIPSTARYDLFPHVA
ncbi:MAG: hypothetical protein HP492_06625 [Nitrospira sp.]|nr:hypothetical protein [Nitrospira sp.]